MFDASVAVFVIAVVIIILFISGVRLSQQARTERAVLAVTPIRRAGPITSDDEHSAVIAQAVLQAVALSRCIIMCADFRHGLKALVCWTFLPRCVSCITSLCIVVCRNVS